MVYSFRRLKGLRDVVPPCEARPKIQRKRRNPTLTDGQERASVKIAQLSENSDRREYRLY